MARLNCTATQCGDVSLCIRAYLQAPSASELQPFSTISHCSERDRAKFETSGNRGANTLYYWYLSSHCSSMLVVRGSQAMALITFTGYSRTYIDGIDFSGYDSPNIAHLILYHHGLLKHTPLISVAGRLQCQPRCRRSLHFSIAHTNLFAALLIIRTFSAAMFELSSH